MLSYEAANGFMKNLEKKSSGASQAKPAHSAEPETEFDFFWQSQITSPILKKIVKTLEYKIELTIPVRSIKGMW